MNIVKTLCPASCGFCWKNPAHWAVALALLPFTLKGIAVLAAWFNAALATVTAG